MWVKDGVIVGVGLGVVRRAESGDTKKLAFPQAARHTFIISRIIARGRYSLIEYYRPRFSARGGLGMTRLHPQLDDEIFYWAIALFVTITLKSTRLSVL